MKFKLIAAVAALALVAGCSAQESASSIEEPPAAQETPAPVWNFDDADASTNGNVLPASRLMLSGDLAAPKDIDAASALKRPWDHYGQLVCFSGMVGIVNDMPPGDEISKALGGQAAEVVIATADQTLVDAIIIGSSDTLKPGDSAKVCGLIAGRVDVENQLGGQSTQLLMVARLAP